MWRYAPEMSEFFNWLPLHVILVQSLTSSLPLVHTRSFRLQAEKTNFVYSICRDSVCICSFGPDSNNDFGPNVNLRSLDQTLFWTKSWTSVYLGWILLNKYFLESLRKQLGDVDIARKAAADQAEENKNLARDIQDVYEEKMAKVGFQIDWLNGLIWLVE